METKQEYLNRIFRTASLRGMCKSQRDFASLLGVNEKAFSSALNGNERYLTDNLVAKVRLFAKENELEQLAGAGETEETVLVIPYGARGGTIGDFLEGVHEYDCEKITSPIKGADYAMEVTGDSMSPEYPIRLPRPHQEGERDLHPMERGLCAGHAGRRSHQAGTQDR